MTGKIPEGQRFSHVYLERGEPIADSKPMRIRMRSLVVSAPALKDSTLVQDKLGLEFYSWRDLFENAEIRYVLDFVTVAYRFFLGRSYIGVDLARDWLQKIQEIFEDENIHYRVDPKGGVHFHYDRAFAQVTGAAIAILQKPRFANCLSEFNKSLASLAKGPPDGKGAIRATFTAIEGLIALMFPEVRRLAAGEVRRLQPLIEKTYSGDRRAQEISNEMLASLRGWIDAAHGYRHEEGKPDTVAQPPLTLAVYLVSTGAAHLRRLAELDAATTK